MSMRRGWALLCAAALLGVRDAQAQAAQALKLKPADAKLDEEFTLIGSVRELSDGRVLITDPRENRVVVADLKAGTVTPVGRTGSGPNEYGMAGPLHALAADSSILFDLSSRRWLLFSGASIVQTLPPDTPIILAMKGSARGADAKGNVWTFASPTQFDQDHAKPGTTETGAADSGFVVRGNRTTAKLDTVARVRQALSRQTVVLNAAGRVQSVSFARAPLAVGEEAVLFPDGWFAVARLDLYRVDWISPDGRTTKGRPLPVPPIKVTSAERDAYFARVRSANPSSAPSKLPASLRSDLDALRDQFPAFIPPFVSFGLIAGGDGNLWLLRQVSMTFPNARYDVVDRRGVLLGVVSLETSERIVSVGSKTVYVAWKDADDIERLRRHPSPLAPIKAP